MADHPHREIEEMEEVQTPRDLEAGLKASNATNPGDSSSEDDDCEKDHDGHRPCGCDAELHPSLTRTESRGTALNLNNASQPNLARKITRRNTSATLSRIRSRSNVAPFDHPLAHQRTEQTALVDFTGPDDPYRSINWPMKKKAMTTLMYGLITMTATWASASFSAGTTQVAEEFGVSTEVATLGSSLFLLGFGIGPLLWAPLSEVYGRRLAVLTPMFVSICFSFATAAAKDLQTIMITRFFAAFFGSAPVTNTGGVLGDLFSPAERGIAMAGYAFAVVGGPTVGPIVSAAVAVQPSLGWRWTEYLTGILQSFVLVLAAILIDESYPQALLVAKARRLRHETGNWALHAKFEEWDISIMELARKFLVRPIQLLTSPICILVALYASFCYGILYMQLGAVPIIFEEVRGWGQVTGELPFLALTLGALTGCCINIGNQVLYNKSYHAAGDRAVPEKRLLPMMLGSVLFAAGLFLTGWTATPSIHWFAPVFGLYLAGAGFNTIFQSALNYLVDTFQMYAASAVAANTFLRSIFAAAFPLVVGPLFNNLGVGPGLSIFGGFACLLLPIPYVFYVFGKRIRAANKWSKGSVFPRE